MKNFLSAFLLLFLTQFSWAQSERWQQSVDYKMNIEMDVKKHQYKGDQILKYTNNSPDRLHKVYFHLFFNAFQPGSMMDVRSRTISDPDSRVGDRIFNLPDDEQGWIKIISLNMDGVKVDYKVEGTILEIELEDPIEPNSTVAFDMEWDAQVPRQIRRSGWDNKESVEYSMTQWYPKMCEYDYQGWHAYPYIGREFYGVWGNFEVNITMPSEYMIGFTGNLQNAGEIGHGYTDVEPAKKKKTLTWKIKAENVHDFAWAADPDFIHEVATMNNGTRLHFIHQDNEEYNQSWADCIKHMVRGFEYLNENFGEYPYKKYSFIQGGDGGMEYPMMTLVRGNRNLKSLVGVCVHEGAHSWYQGVLGSNEMLHSWMDEGFTSFATAKTMDHLFDTGQEHLHLRGYAGYFNILHSGNEEPLETNADFLKTNAAYWAAAYSKGETFIAQLGYVIGNKNRDRALLKYYEEWKFKHPNPNDVMRIMEKESGMNLDWYLHFFANTTDSIDYGIKSVMSIEGTMTEVTLEKIGYMPMPLDVEVTYRDGRKEIYYIPLTIMRGEKPNEYDATRKILPDWPWTNKEYIFQIEGNMTDILRIIIDPKKEMADSFKENNNHEIKKKRPSLQGSRVNQQKTDR